MGKITFFTGKKLIIRQEHFTLWLLHATLTCLVSLSGSQNGKSLIESWLLSGAWLITNSFLWSLIEGHSLWRKSPAGVTRDPRGTLACLVLCRCGRSLMLNHPDNFCFFDKMFCLSMLILDVRFKSSSCRYPWQFKIHYHLELLTRGEVQGGLQLLFRSRDFLSLIVSVRIVKYMKIMRFFLSLPPFKRDKVSFYYPGCLEIPYVA